MAKPPTPRELIAKADEDGSGTLSKTEWQSITDKISLHHNKENFRSRSTSGTTWRTKLVIVSLRKNLIA
jgi:hypothetical protein